MSTATLRGGGGGVNTSLRSTLAKKEVIGRLGEGAPVQRESDRSIQVENCPHAAQRGTASLNCHGPRRAKREQKTKERRLIRYYRYALSRFFFFPHFPRCRPGKQVCASLMCGGPNKDDLRRLCTANSASLERNSVI